eukprot:704396-Amphidinium_carterae.3
MQFDTTVARDMVPLPPELRGVGPDHALAVAGMPCHGVAPPPGAAASCSAARPAPLPPPPQAPPSLDSQAIQYPIPATFADHRPEATCHVDLRPGAKIQYLRPTGQRITLALRYIPRAAKWPWQDGGKPRWTSSDRPTPQEALDAWIHLHALDLDPDEASRLRRLAEGIRTLPVFETPLYKRPVPVAAPKAGREMRTAFRIPGRPPQLIQFQPGPAVAPCARPYLKCCVPLVHLLFQDAP